MQRELRTKLNQLAAGQRGLATRQDLRRLGVTRDQVIGLQRNGALVPVGARTFQMGGLPPDALRPILAACYDLGGVASHRTAAALHGLHRFESSRSVDVLVRRVGGKALHPGVTIHTTTNLSTDDLTAVDGIPCTSVARTLLLLAGLVPRVPVDVVRGAVDDAIRTGAASDGWLWWRLEKLRCRGRNGVSVLESILTRRARGEVTESWLERTFLEVIRAAGVPVPVCQARIGAQGAFVARVDFLYPSSGVVIEVTGAKGHSTPAQRAADARRRNRLVTLGFLVLEFTYEQVVGDPTAVAIAVVAALQARAQGSASAPIAS